MDLEKAIRMAVDTGEVAIGARSVERALSTNKAKLVLLASNCPSETKVRIQSSAKIAGVKVKEFPGTSLHLGSVCGKPFPVSALAIINEGDSDILKV